MWETRLITIICSWAAILAWIRCGALAFVVTPTHQLQPIDTRENAAAGIFQSVSLHSWFGVDDDVGVVSNWDSDQDEVELTNRMEPAKRDTLDYEKHWTVSSSDQVTVEANATIDSKRMKREKRHRRKSGLRTSSGSGATSDGVSFSSSVPQVMIKDPTHTHTPLVVDAPKSTEAIHQPSSRWYLTLDKSTGLQVPLNMSIATKEPIDKAVAARAKAESAFQVKPTLLRDDKNSETSVKTSKREQTEQRIRQLASLLNIPIASARAMIRRVPQLGSMNIASTLSPRCIAMSLVLQCSPSKFASIVRHFPVLLTFRPETIATKLLQLDRLLSGECLDDHSILINSFSSGETLSYPFVGNETVVDVSESTLSIARRVPQLLASNIPGTLAKRATALHSLFANAMKEEEEEKTHAFTRLLKRCPELLLYNIDTTISPKLDELDSLFEQDDGSSMIEKLQRSISGRTLGMEIALREPRLLLYDIRKSLAPKANEWKARVDNESSFTALLIRYPTLLMYSLGAAARLEYFAYKNHWKPDASEARQLLMLSKKVVDSWGEERAGGDSRLLDSTPAILGGTVSRRGRPRSGESAVEASSRRESRRKSCPPLALEELKVNELRKLLRENGGVPASKRKSQLISDLRMLELDAQEGSSSNSISSRGVEPLLSYREWLTIKLCSSYPQSLETSDGVTLDAAGRSAGDLEKLYGEALKASTRSYIAMSKP